MPKLEYKVYEPATAERYALGRVTIQSEAQLETHAAQWIIRELERRKALCQRTGVANPVLQEVRKNQRFTIGQWAVCCLLNTTEEKPIDVRHFNMVPLQAAGALDYAVTLHSGEWRLATEEEELAAFEQNQPQIVKEARAKVEARTAPKEPKPAPVGAAKGK